MGYYKSGVLANFQSQPDKYEISIDEFEGEVQLTTQYARDAEQRNEDIWLSVSFGFRRCTDGEWAVAAYIPDLAKSSPGEKLPWIGFRLGEDAFPDELDERFQKWIDRYIKGSWEVPAGPFASLDAVVSQLNAIARCVVNKPLLGAANFRRLCFPLAENNHRYHDAHSEVYKLAIDGLNRAAIKALGDRLGIAVNPSDKTRVNALEKLLISRPVRNAVREALDHISSQRRLAGHNARPQALKFRAFEEFGKDMRSLVDAFEILRDDLARRLNVDIARCCERAAALDSMPLFDPSRPPRPNYSILSAFRMQGKHVVRVSGGELFSKPGRPESEEAIALEFSDGSLMGIEAATNISQLLGDGEPIKPEDLHISFQVNYVPPMLPFTHPDQNTDSLP